ncbi:AAA family ATPase [Candidatus Albibeggiatoa sp. nov. NOAA]|uniref:AAA family ATPase n=1 Tax=Candidatus Albibeggiatoa sp. nov. NOAA TaxID=3162724 RepID=UPI0033005A18|nr:AAA family ATPase [Thiotrichaceae bacterium]
MKFTFKNLGIFEKETTLELGDLTIICGQNNTGKTYASYAIFGFLDTWNRNIDFDIPEQKIKELYSNGVIELNLDDFAEIAGQSLSKLSIQYSSFLHKVFSTSEDFFQSTQFVAHSSVEKYVDTVIGSTITTVEGKEVLKFEKQKDFNVLQISLLVEANKDKKTLPSTQMITDFIDFNVGRSLFSFPNPFVISSERTGVSLFHRELDISKNVIVERLQNSDKQLQVADYFEMIEEATSRYAKPVKEGIDFVRDIIDIHSKKKSELIKENPEFLRLIQNIVGGEYQVKNDQIIFAFRKGRRKEKIPLYMASSTVKSMLELYFYITSIAKKGDILMIDEPELNLHPANQRKLARLFAHLVKAGIKVFITTHSDYLIKELNNLIMLSNDFEYKEEVLKNLKDYSPEDNLSPSHIKAYIADKKTLIPAPITEYGIEVESFDDEIDAINHAFNEITLALGI